MTAVVVAREPGALEVLTPAARAGRPFPRIAVPVWTAAVLLSIVNPSSWGGVADTVDGIAKLVALLAACSMTVWLEERVFDALTGRSSVLRVLVALVLPGLFLLGAPVVGITLGPLLSWAGDQSTAGLSGVFAMLWASSAATGSLVVVLIDVVVSALVQSFRARVQLAVLILVGLSSAAAGATALLANNLSSLVSSSTGSVRVSLPNKGQLERQDVAQLLSDPDFVGLLTLLLVVVFVAMSLPAVLSACGKLADAVMERVHPLAQAFEAVGKGNLSVRVEEGGSRDFRALGNAFNQMVAQLSLARNMERAFGQYVSGQVLDRIRDQHGEAVLPAELREATVFFADVRGFTSMSERLEPAQVLGVMNRYFDRAVAIIDEHEGYLDKFIGDAVVVVFNGPIDQPDHAERGARCAIALQREVARLNAAGAFPEIAELKVGVGVSTGSLVAGNLGSTRHMEYTVIGDTVNLAARLTGQAPAGEVWVSERNAELLPASIARQRLEPFSVKGKTRPVTAYRVWPLPGASLPAPGAGEEAPTNG